MVGHHAGGALHLGKGRHMRHAVALGEAAAHAHKDRYVGGSQKRLGDDRLGGEGIDGDDGVSVGVFDDGQICGEHQGFDPLAKYHNARAAVDGLGYLQGGFAVGSLNGGGDVLHSGTRPLCKFLSLYHDDAAIWITDC